MADHVLVLHWFGLPWHAALVDSGISNFLLLLACLLVMNTLRYYLPRGGTIRQYFFPLFIINHYMAGNN